MIVKIIFGLMWIVFIIFSLYLFKKTLVDLSDASELYAVSFFYAIVIVALTIAFLPIVIQSKDK
ncbi:MAG: hypothetical protein N2446_02245 [Elusimicrobiales bacterium]|nr:hypothetical protein [Elusimicrobiales bacterium]